MNRFGSTASDTLQALHRAADLELADEGGIAPLDYENQRHIVPLTEMPGSWRTFAIRAVWLVSYLVLLAVGIAWVVGAVK